MLKATWMWEQEITATDILFHLKGIGYTATIRMIGRGLDSRAVWSGTATLPDGSVIATAATTNIFVTDSMTQAEQWVTDAYSIPVFWPDRQVRYASGPAPVDADSTPAHQIAVNGQLHV